MAADHMHTDLGNSAVDDQRCPFCHLEPGRIFVSNEHAVAVLDGFPVNPGHALIIPRRHIVSLFEATIEEREGLFDLLAEAREQLRAERKPDGFNIGINDGAAAGQTIFHLHIHLIPRYVGDIDDFIPWSRYPLDLGHNFVLAHSTCNRSKRDFLAARCHLEKWQKRNHVHGTTLGQEFDAQGILHNRKATEKIAIWAYSQAEAASANLWLRKDDVSPIDPGWRDVLSAAL